MVAFVTLLLGLSVGAQQLELRGSGVESIELRLDDRVVATLLAPPWRTTIDLGPELSPHELVAIGRDRAGAEVARARQLVNMPRFPAEASMTLLPGSGGRGRKAMLVWKNSLGTPPTKVSVTLDNRAVQTTTSPEISIPDFDPARIHVLRVELEFSENLVAVTEIVFGGRDREDAVTALTGVPIVPRPPAKDLPPRLDGCLGIGASAARIAAVEQGPGEVVVVRDEAAKGPLMQLEPRESRAALQPELPRGQRLRFLWPVTRPSAEVADDVDVFMRSPESDASSGYLQRLLARTNAPAVSRKPRFADAIATAAVTAVARNRARAILFLYGGTEDFSRLGPEIVRRYLKRVHVPLFVWAVDGDSARQAEKWGDVSVVRDLASFLEASRRLLDEVGMQRMAWLEGRHLPQSVTILDSSCGIRFAE